MHLLARYVLSDFDLPVLLMKLFSFILIIGLWLGLKRDWVGLKRQRSAKFKTMSNWVTVFIYKYFF